MLTLVNILSLGSCDVMSNGGLGLTSKWERGFFLAYRTV